MRTRGPSFFPVLVALVMVGGVLGCSSGGAGGSLGQAPDPSPGTGGLAIVATLRSGSSSATSLASSATIPEEFVVWPVPLESNQLRADALGDIEPVVPANGSLRIPVSSDRDYVLVISAPPGQGERIDPVAFLTLGDSESSVLKMPVSDNRGTDVDLGELSESGAELVGSTTLEEATSYFELTTAQLLELARSDDIFKGVSNLLANYDREADVYYQATPFWGGSQMPAGNVDGTGNVDAEGFSKPSDYLSTDMERIGIWIRLDTNAYSAEQSGYSLTFPEQTQVDLDGDGVGEATTTLDQGSGGGTLVGHDHYPEERRSAFYFGSGFSILELPDSGETLFDGDGDGVPEARYDFSLEKPVNAGNVYTVPVPKVKVKANASTGVLEEVRVKWELHDGTTYREIQDPKILQQSVTSMAINLNPSMEVGEFNQTQGPELSAETVWKSFEETWSWDGSGSGRTFSSLVVEYGIGGTMFFWSWSTQYSEAQ